MQKFKFIFNYTNKKVLEEQLMSLSYFNEKKNNLFSYDYIGSNKSMRIADISC